MGGARGLESPRLGSLGAWLEARSLRTLSPGGVAWCLRPGACSVPGAGRVAEHLRPGSWTRAGLYSTSPKSKPTTPKAENPGLESSFDRPDELGQARGGGHRWGRHGGGSSPHQVSTRCRPSEMDPLASSPSLS